MRVKIMLRREMTGSDLCSNQISLAALWRLSKMGWGGVGLGGVWDGCRETRSPQEAK